MSRATRSAATSTSGTEKTQKILNDVEEVKGVMTKNIDVLLQNHEKLENVEAKSSEMQHHANVFKKQATAVKKEMWWKNCKLCVIIILIVVAALAALGICVILPIVLKLT
ncbi:vesicle-associated membrane protein 4 [Pelomyxa schiedti]|nr:vesicle-associated membrane protein 4 [Pelomyxa schiedti]